MVSLYGALRGQTKHVICSGTKYCEVDKKNVLTVLSKAILQLNRNADLTVTQFWVSVSIQRKLRSALVCPVQNIRSYRHHFGKALRFSGLKNGRGKRKRERVCACVRACGCERERVCLVVCLFVRSLSGSDG
jgi:hypothetical protein